MEISAISSEQDLRQWLSEQVKTWNKNHQEKVGHVWIEPGFGSTNGIPDASLSFRSLEYGVELKHFKVTAKGVCYKIRPVQRRYNVMGVRNGKRLFVLATIDRTNYNELVMIRGDKVPLRDYCCELGSGCETSISQTIIPHEFAFRFMLETMSRAVWWPAANEYSEGQKGLQAIQQKQ